MSPVMTGTGERPVIADLAVGKCADQQIASLHVRKSPFGIERASREPVEHRISQVGGVLFPQIQHGGSMGPFVNIPVTGIAMQPVGKFFPHERGMFCRGSLRLIELSGTTTPHDGRGKRTFLMVTDNL